MSDMSIPLDFSLFWSGGKLSYLRYLTFLTLRYYHPDERITLYTVNKFSKNANWKEENQDFQFNYNGEDYLEKLKDLNIQTIEVLDNDLNKYEPNYQSDFFRWHWLYEYGGFYLDCDQIILKPFSQLDLSHDLIYTKYKLSWGKMYFPVGVIGMSARNPISTCMIKSIPLMFNKNDYNSIGPWAFGNVMENGNLAGNYLNTDSDIFYPIPESFRVVELYDGSFQIPEKSFACHWFGGHPESQKFNLKYNEEFAKISNDTISVELRKRDII